MINKSHVILSTAYFGPVEYFGAILNTRKILIEHEETYVKQSYRNRCSIDGAGGRLDLTIPVIKANGNHTQIKDIRISNSEKWQLNHWRAIKSSYNHSPFFMFYQDDIEPFYSKKFDFLIDFNYQLLTTLLNVLSHNVRIEFTTHFKKPMTYGISDLRYSIHPKTQPEVAFPRYTQVFENNHGFISNLSIIDLLFNMGPDSKNYLKNLPLFLHKLEQAG